MHNEYCLGDDYLNNYFVPGYYNTSRLYIHPWTICQGLNCSILLAIKGAYRVRRQMARFNYTEKHYMYLLNCVDAIYLLKKKTKKTSCVKIKY